MKKIIFILLVLSLTVPVIGQEITRAQANDLLNSLREQLNDTLRIHNMLMLAEFNILRRER